jgi:hypothetical protein
MFLTLVALDALLVTLVHVLPNAFVPFQESFVIHIPDLFGGILLLLAGILVIAVLIAAAVVLLPAIIAAAAVWLLTGSIFLAGVAFLLIAIVWLVAIADD